MFFLLFCLLIIALFSVLFRFGSSWVRWNCFSMNILHINLSQSIKMCECYSFYLMFFCFFHFGMFLASCYRVRVLVHFLFSFATFCCWCFARFDVWNKTSKYEWKFFSLMCLSLILHARLSTIIREFISLLCGTNVCCCSILEWW